MSQDPEDLKGSGAELGKLAKVGKLPKITLRPSPCLQYSPPPVDSIPAPSLDDLVAACKDGDQALAQLMADRFRPFYCYDLKAASWYRFNGRAWERDDSQWVNRATLDEFVRLLKDGKEEAEASLLTVCKAAGVDPYTQAPGSLQRNPAVSKAYSRYSALSETLKRLNRAKAWDGFLSLLQTGGYLGIDGKVWDIPAGDPREFLLVAKNGVLNLKTWEFAPQGNPNDWLRSSLSTNYNRDAQCPRWQQFLSEILTDVYLDDHEREADAEANSRHLQKIIGMSLLRHSKQHCALILYGSMGGNGKDRFITAIQNTLGSDLIGPLDKALLMKQKQEADKSSLLSLQYKHLAILSESRDGGSMDQEAMKRLTGGAELIVRAPYAKLATTFTPFFLPILLTNYLPSVQQDQATRRRLHVFSLKRQFLPNPNPSRPHEAPADIELDAKLAAEAEGILLWILEGLRAFMADKKLTWPPAMESLIDDFFKDSDPLAEFQASCLDYRPGASCTLTEVHAAYKAFCEEQQAAKVLDRPSFKKALLRDPAIRGKNIGRKSVSGQKAQEWELSGIRLHDAQAEQERTSLETSRPLF